MISVGETHFSGECDPGENEKRKTHSWNNPRVIFDKFGHSFLHG